MNFTIGLDLDVTVNDDCLDSSDSCLVFNNIGMNFTVEDFEQVVDMEVYLSKPVSKYFSYKWVQFVFTAREREVDGG